MDQKHFDARLDTLSTGFSKSSSRVTRLKGKTGSVNDVYRDLHMFSHYVDMHCDISQRNDEIPLHSHSFWELLYCFDGSVDYLLGSQRLCVQRGDIIIIPPHVSHRPLFTEHFEPPYSRIVMWLNAELPTKLQDVWSVRCPEEAMLLRTAATPWEHLGEYFFQGCKVAEMESGHDEQFLLGDALCLAYMLERAISGEPPHSAAPEHKDLLSDVISYVDAHLADKITLADVAHHFLVSESTISKTFRRHMDVSFYRYVIQRRLLLAKKLMWSGLPLDQIYSQVGFKDYSSFYRSFKQEFDISPNQYRSLFPDVL